MGFPVLEKGRCNDKPKCSLLNLYAPQEVYTRSIPKLAVKPKGSRLDVVILFAGTADISRKYIRTEANARSFSQGQ
eukprot:6467052-Amphidinium_carterae.1